MRDARGVRPQGAFVTKPRILLSLAATAVLVLGGAAAATAATPSGSTASALPTPSTPSTPLDQCSTDFYEGNQLIMIAAEQVGREAEVVRDPLNIGRCRQMGARQVLIELLTVDSYGPADRRNRAPQTADIAQIGGQITCRFAKFDHGESQCSAID